jgi:hypothetical protein
MFEAVTKRYNKSHACFIKKILLRVFIDSLVDYPSVFHSINNDSSNLGYSTNQAPSSTNDTADSEWQQSEEKSNSTRSVDGSVSDTSFSTYQNSLTSVYDAKHQSRPKPNYILDSANQDSHYQEQTQQNAVECQEECIKDGSEENSEYEDSVCQGDPLIKGQFCAPTVRFFQFLKNIHLLTLMFVQGMAMTNLAGVTKIIRD